MLKPHPIDRNAFLDRIKHRMKELGIPSERALTVKAGVGANTIANYRTGRASLPNSETAAKLANALEMSVSQLLFERDQDEQTSFDTDNIIDDVVNHMTSEEIASNQSTAEAVLHGLSNAIVELADRAGMGGGELVSTAYRADESGVWPVDAVKQEPWLFPSSFMREKFQGPPSKLFIQETKGDSMFPTIGHGDRVVVDSSHIIPSPDGIYAIRDRYGFIEVKRIEKRKEGLMKISDNPIHGSELLRDDEIDIVGRVVLIMRQV